MLESRPDPGITAPTDTFGAAYRQLVDDLERALWLDESGAVVNAYQAYTDACEQALADPQVQQRVTRALEDLSAALGRALERPEARAHVEEAATSYIRAVGAAWPELRAHETGVEALLAVATGMTTLAWLFGLGSSGLVAPFGLGGGLGGGWGAGSSNGFADAFAPPAFEEPADPATGADDDGIVWQEFDVGEDGEIVQKQASAARETAGDRSAPPRRPEPGPEGGDPAERVRRALAEYEAGLRSLGVPVASAAGAASDVDRRGAELGTAYLRLLYGGGTAPDVYAHYARLLESATELLERQVTLARGYEQLLQAALQGRRPEQLRRAADDRYQRLLATIRDAWSTLDPAAVTAEQLADLAATTAHAARLHEATRAGRAT